MDCKITSTKNHSRLGERGLTLVEMMVAATLGIIILGVICMVVLYSNQNFASLYNYASLDNQSHLALDKMTKKIRGGGPLISFSSTTVTFTNLNSAGTVSYLYDSNSQTLSSIESGQTNIYLTDCKSLSFSMYQRTPQPGSFVLVQATNVSDCKLLQVQWCCAKSLWQGQTNESETMRSASIILRNSGP
jgi:hypothetical protein